MTGDDDSACDHSDDSWHSYRIAPDESPTEAVVVAVSAVTNTPVEDLSVLYSTIDPDALDLLLSSAQANDAPFRVSFTYHGCDVIVTDRYVRVRETE